MDILACLVLFACELLSFLRCNCSIGLHIRFMLSCFYLFSFEAIRFHCVELATLEALIDPFLLTDFPFILGANLFLLLFLLLTLRERKSQH